ncbi:MAG TPA: hypothetical protein ENI73_00920 [Spirochaetes bacterium]|nr:hypothetical protein [Spirochaetota bacterium]
MDNYYLTAGRSFRSSHILHENDEFHMACYLAGYVIECYAKCVVMIVQGANSNQRKKFGHNLEKLNKEIDYLLNDSTISGLIDSKYLISIKIDCPTILIGHNKWDPLNRYDDSGYWDNENTSLSYQNEIKNVMNILKLMRTDGIL